MTDGSSVVNQPRISELLNVEDQRALLEGLFLHAPMALQIYRPNGHCLFVNDAFVKLFGSAPPPDYCILKDEIAVREGTLELVHRAFAGETVRMPAVWYDARELEQVDVKEGRRCAIEITFLPLLDAAGATRYVALVFKDVTPDVKLKQERARISRDLHDEVATELTALVWKSREIAAELPAGVARNELLAFEDRLRGALSDLRDVVISLRREKLGVREAVTLLERRCRELAGAIAIGFEVLAGSANSDTELATAEVWGDTLPICFELVRNAAFHSGASRIQVMLELGSALVVTVADDGHGLLADRFERSDGGLLGIRQRASELGGSVRLVPSERGTTIAVTLPR